MDRQVVLITGCSTGIGRATATLLAAAGFRVVATARRQDALEGIGAAMTQPLDVTDNASIASAVGATLERYGRIDVLINNAGYAIRGAVEEVDITGVQRMFDVNVNGIIRMVRAVAPSMRLQGSGRILNIGSIGGKLAGPANGTYAASKHAVEALSDAMRWELAPFGIDVVLIEPGEIKTNFLETALRGSRSLLDRRDSPYAALYARLAAVTSAQRVHESGPEAVASTVLAALRARRPHARYEVAVSLATRIAAALPDGAKDLLMRSLYGIRSVPKGPLEQSQQASYAGAKEVV
jgi:NADP-dependent 3-hydroxy acid dehydrogenase YdfG